MLLVVENSILFFVCFFVIVKIHWRRGWYFMTVSWQLPVCWKEPTFFNSNVRLLCKNNWNRCACVLCVCLCASVDCVMLPVPTSSFWHFLSRWAQSDQEYHVSSLAVLCWFVLLSPRVVFLSTHFPFSAFISLLFSSLFFVCVFFLFFLSPCCFFNFWVVL